MPDSSSRPLAPSSDEGAGVGLAEGAVLAERYRLRRLLGRGGMGSVWEAEHILLGQTVAIKLIRPELAGNERSRARFLREAQAAAGLKSPYVVQIFDYGVEGDIPYIAMERLEGESLAERLRREQRLSPEQLVVVMAQVARAIGKAHAAGIVHRDLKPDNVFIVSDEDGERCKVLDFGIAKVLPQGGVALETNTNTNTMVGTPYYMSPEQATDSREVGPPSDLWSMAVIAYQCLVGERPFDGGTLPTLAVKILVEPIPVPSEHASVPPGFDAWFARATQRDPQERFGSARAQAKALAEALEVQAPSVSVSLPPTVRPRRRPGLPAVLAAAGAGLIGWWVVRGGQDSERSTTAAVESRAAGAGESIAPASTTAEGEVPAGEATAAVVAAPTTAASSGAAEVETGGPEAPAPGSVTLSFTGPAGASVYQGDALLGTLPGSVTVPRSEEAITLRVLATGYHALELSVVPDGDQQLSLELHKRRKGSGTGKKTRPDSSAHPEKPNVDDLEF